MLVLMTTVALTPCILKLFQDLRRRSEMIHESFIKIDAEYIIKSDLEARCGIAQCEGDARDASARILLAATATTLDHQA